VRRTKARSGRAVAALGFDSPGHAVALDEAALLAGGLAQRGRGEAVDLAHGAGGGLVQKRDGVGRKELAVAASALQTQAQVLGGVLGHERLDGDAMVESRVQRAIAAECQATTQLGQPDEDE